MACEEADQVLFGKGKTSVIGQGALSNAVILQG
jgi:hypothetical protein